MANIARFNPFDDTIDDLFRGFFVRPISYEGANGAAQFRVDVSENDSAYTLRAEIPGVKKNEINVSIDGDTVAISAEVKNDKDVKNGERVLRTERYYARSIARLRWASRWMKRLLQPSTPKVCWN